MSLEEKRETQRVQHKFTTRIRFPDKSTPERWDIIFLLNLSAGGVLFRYNEKLVIGERLELAISFLGAEELLVCEAHVLRVTPIGTAQFCEVAAEFKDMDEATKVQIAQAAEKFRVMNTSQIKK